MQIHAIALLTGHSCAQDAEEDKRLSFDADEISVNEGDDEAQRLPQSVISKTSFLVIYEQNAVQSVNLRFPNCVRYTPHCSEGEKDWFVVSINRRPKQHRKNCRHVNKGGQDEEWNPA